MNLKKTDFLDNKNETDSIGYITHTDVWVSECFPEKLDVFIFIITLRLGLRKKRKKKHFANSGHRWCTFRRPAFIVSGIALINSYKNKVEKL
jgi:hypothetical protein